MSCRRCNEHKGIQTDGIDPDTGERVPVFHVQRLAWHEHFAWSGDGALVIGLTPCGRASVLALKLNTDDMVVARRLWVSVGWHPPNESYATLPRMSSPALFALRSSLTTCTQSWVSCSLRREPYQPERRTSAAMTSSTSITSLFLPSKSNWLTRSDKAPCRPHMP